MKINRILLLAAALLAAAAFYATAYAQKTQSAALAAREEIGDPVEKPKQTVDVVEVSRVWRVQADADGQATVFFETVRRFPDGTEVLLARSSTSRPVLLASAPLDAIEKLARAWAAEDAAQPPAAP